jgi:hypothetical protein
MARFFKGFNFWAFLRFLGVAALVAYAISAFSKEPFWMCFAVTAIAILANGWLATWEDEQPGGFNNPTDDQRETKEPR